MSKHDFFRMNSFRQVAITVVSENAPLITFKPDGTYEMPGSFEEMIASEYPVVRAFGAALRDHYEAGLKGERAPKFGKTEGGPEIA